MVQRARLISGLILFAFVTSHLVNHSLGLISLDALAAGLSMFQAVWAGPVGQAALYGALLVHLAAALYRVFERRSLRMPGWELAQLLLGLAIPLLLVEHLLGTRGLFQAHGVLVNYPFVLTALWVFKPVSGVLQAVLVSVAWLHGCIGMHYWLRVRPWYPATAPWLLALAVVIPTLALTGYGVAGGEIREVALDPTAIEQMLSRVRFSEAAGRFVEAGTPAAIGGFLAIVGIVLVARYGRLAIHRRPSLPRIHHAHGHVIPVLPGATVLEAIRGAGIEHASVCGGRGRCSTCRVRVGAGADALPQPDAVEQRVLARIGAPPTVRLACQIRPGRDIEVTPLLPSTAAARDGRPGPTYHSGQEREIAILFADLREFTKLSESRLPYDVVFLLNRYFEAMGGAIERSQGRLDKFIGDGVMALFGVEAGPEEGCRRALTAARAMGLEMQALNRTLRSDLHNPLRIGIGIHVGPAIVGDMGYGRAKSLTAVGDAVNTASRLEGLTKEFKAELVISEAVAKRAGVDLPLFPTHQVEVRGRSGGMTVRVVSRAADLPAV